MKHVLATIAAGLATLLLAGPVAAQFAVFPTAEPGHWARAEATRPDPVGEETVRGLSSAWFFTLYQPIPGSVVLVAELPIAYADIEGQGGTSMAVGNPYFGARMQFSGRALSEFEIGIRLPLSPDQGGALELGLLTDLVDRAEAFHPQTMPLTLRGVRSFELGPSAAIDLAAGSIWWMMSALSRSDHAVFFTYSAQARAELGGLQATAGLSGRNGVLGRQPPELQGGLYQLGAALDYDLRSIRPGMFVTLPLTEPGTGLVDTTIGFRLLVPLGESRR